MPVSVNFTAFLKADIPLLPSARIVQRNDMIDFVFVDGFPVNRNTFHLLFSMTSLRFEDIPPPPMPA